MLVKDDFSEFWLMGDIFASLTSSQYVFSFFFFLEEGGSLGGNEKGTDGKHIV